MPKPSEALRRLFSPFAVLIAGVLLVILGAKFLLIQQYGSDLPFWDQWDAEGDRLYIPAANGTLEAGELLHPHNEHRIVFTKALALGLLKANGQWDARLQMTVNAALHVAALALLVALLLRGTRLPTLLCGTLLAALLFGLPFTWENTLGGFQSQFYFLLLFSVLHLGGTLRRPSSTRRLALAQIAGLCAVFTMASGFFSAAVVVGVTTLRILRERRGPRAELLLLGFNLALVVLGLALRTEFPPHAYLKAHSLKEFFEAVQLLIGWPSPFAFLLVFTLAPLVAMAWRWWRKSSPENERLTLILGLAVWYLIQVVAMAYARGGEGHALSPRYFDTLAIGTLLSGILWCEWLLNPALPPIAQWTVRAAGLFWLVAVFHGLRYQTQDAEKTYLEPLLEVNRLRIDTVAAFVSAPQPSFYSARPWFDLPYPSADRLGQLLGNANLSALLPSSVRAVVPVYPELNRGFAPNGAGTVKPFPPGRAGWSSFGRDPGSNASFRSGLMHPPRSAFLRFFVTGDLAPGKGSIFLETTRDRILIAAGGDTSRGWKSVVVDAPRTEFRIVAESAENAALAFTDPVELPFLSWLTRHVLKTGPPLFWIGLCGILTAAILLIRRNSGRGVDWKSASTRLASNRTLLFSLFVVLLVLAVRKSDALLHPRFWAEDGQIFFEQAVQFGSASLFTPYSGYHHLIPRLVALSALRFDFVVAPTFYVIASVAVTLLAAGIILSPRLRLPFKPLWALAMVAVPHTGEVFLNITNLQWITGLGLVLLALKDDTADPASAAGDGLLVLLFGLTGPFVIALSPLFAARAFVFRSRASFAVLLAAGLAAAIQLEALATSPAPNSGSVSLLTAAEIAGFRTFGRLLLSGPLGTKLGHGIAAGAGALFACVLLFLGFRQRERWREFLFLWFGLVGLTAAAVVRFGSQLELLRNWEMGDRYFYIPSVIALWILILIGARRGRFALVAGVLILAVNVGQFFSPPYLDDHWDQIAPRLQAGEEMRVTVNPGFVVFDHRNVPEHDLPGPRGRFGEHVFAYAFTWLSLLPLLAATEIAFVRRSWFGAWRLLVSLGATCLAGLLVFWAYFLGPGIGLTVAALLLLASTVYLADRHDPLRSYLREELDARDALLVAGLIGFAYLAVLHLHGSALRADELAESRFLPDLPSDDRIPEVFARRLLDGQSPKRLFDDWLSSDRPPLQTGVVLLGSWLGRALHCNFLPLSQAAGLWFQLLWVSTLWMCGRWFGLARSWCLGLCVAAATTGFFLVNSAYVWPKLGGAALVFAGFALWFTPNRHPRVTAIACGGLCSLGWLSHGGVAFSLVGLAALTAVYVRRFHFTQIALAVGAFLLVAVPWTAYQKFYEPPGNRLVKWHLGGAVSIDPRGVMETITDAYRQIGFSGTLARKRDNLATTVMGDYSQLLDFSSEGTLARRGSQFYFMFLSLWHWNLAWLILPWLAWRYRRSPEQSPTANRLYLVLVFGFVSYLAWVLLMFGGEHATVIHQSSYAILLCWFASLLSAVLLLHRGVFIGFLAFGLLGFLTTWLPTAGSPDSPLVRPCLYSLIAVAAALGAYGWSLRSRSIRLPGGGEREARQPSPSSP